MAASPQQVAANRQNALRSTGPRTDEGKENSRRNALKHGLTGAGVVVPGEDEHELSIRVAQLQEELAPAGDAVAKVLVRQLAMASIRTERAFRHETALAAERMRRAGDVFDDDRRSTAEEILADLPLDPATCRRRLLMAPEGVDALIGRLRALREKATPRTFVAWDLPEGEDFDRCLGDRPEAEVKTRVGLLTRGIVYNSWEGLDPAAIAELTAEGRILWALDQLATSLDAEVARLTALRATLDPARVARSRAEAPERALLDLGKDGTALRRYASAAERMIFRTLEALGMRPGKAAGRPAGPAPSPGVVEVLAAATAEAAEASAGAARAAKAVRTAEASRVAPVRAARDGSGSFGLTSPDDHRPGLGPMAGAFPGDPGAAEIPFTIGRSPRRAGPPTP